MRSFVDRKHRAAGRLWSLLPAVLLGLYGAGSGARGQVPQWAVAIFPSGAEFDLEIVADPEERRRGYMYRERVGRGEGMLFLFEWTGRHSFWMKNCRVSLDIIWLDERLDVVEIAHDRAPCPQKGECPRLTPMVPARYVLEVAGGTAERERLGVGDRIRVVSETPIPP